MYVCVCVFVIKNFKIREYIFLLRILDSIELIRILRNCMNPQDLNVKVSKDSSKILETYETLLSVTWETAWQGKLYLGIYKGKNMQESFPVDHMIVYGLIENPVVLNK